MKPVRKTDNVKIEESTEHTLEVERPAELDEELSEELNERRQSKELSVPIVLSHEALTVESLPSTAAAPKYSAVALKTEKKGDGFWVLAKTLIALALVGLFGFLIFGQVSRRMKSVAKRSDAPVESTANRMDTGSHDVSDPLARCPSDTESCYVIATNYLAGNDFESAARYFAEACKFKLGRACSGLGRLYLQGKGVAQSRENAADSFRRGCELANGASCTNLAAVLAGDAALATTFDEALNALMKACDLNVPQACSRVAAVYGKADGVAKDDAKSNAFLTKACKLGDQESCRVFKSH